MLVDGRPAEVMSLLPGAGENEATERCAYDLPVCYNSSVMADSPEMAKLCKLVKRLH